ncbi:MAG: hypothetical protein O3A25_01075 [Acidobacteria bacterium]|nr:hypothetical protein [Acidobacteriota bacterium]
MQSAPVGESKPASPGRTDGPDLGLIAAVAVFVLGSFLALSIDAPRTLRGIKGDEATYVAMAMSLAYDRDLVYVSDDEERFFAVYQTGPQGIYLKKGVKSFFEVDSVFPYVHRGTYPEGRDDRLFFGKAFISSVFAAPFVLLAGVNGMVWFNVTLLAGMVWCGYRFVAARAPRGAALGYVLAFFGASIAPLYVVWLTAEMFNLAVVFFAYFLWFYKEVAPEPTTRLGRWLRGPSSDIAAAVLLGLAVFSKLMPAALVLPPVLHLWRQGQFRRGLAVGCVAAGVSWAVFGLNAAITGEFNYQGGLDRRYVAGEFPFEPGADWDDPRCGPASGGCVGERVSTDRLVVEEQLGLLGNLMLVPRNMTYFLFGRHFGFVPFFFPGVLAVLLLWRARREAFEWQWVTFGTAVLVAVFLAVWMPNTWSGGGGPTGNRYYLTVYALFFFLTPRLHGPLPTIAACIGGWLFVGQILVDPFVSAREPYLAPQRGLFRLLPVELTMVRDLPIALDQPRARVLHGTSPMVQLYFLDNNASLPEPPGIWIHGDRRADIVVRNAYALETITITAESPVPTELSIDIGGREGRIVLEPDAPGTGPTRHSSGSVTIRPRGVHSRNSWAYLMQVTSKGGFVPKLVDPDSEDERYLSAAISLTATPSTAP